MSDETGTSNTEPEPDGTSGDLHPDGPGEATIWHSIIAKIRELLAKLFRR